MQFTLKKPCSNCPFKKRGAIELSPGRLESIISDLESADTQWFMCHKTVHNEKLGGEWVENEDGENEYHSTGKESQCVGSMVYLLKTGNPSVSMRMAAALKIVDFKDLEAQFPNVIDPIECRKSK